MFINKVSTTEENNLIDSKTAGKVVFNTSAGDYMTNEAFKTLRSNILFSGKNIKSILFTSTQENEGKSTVTTELAKSFTENNKKVLVIDADMRKSILIRTSNKSQKFLGLSEYLSGQATLNQVLYNTQNPSFDIIFSGHFPPNPVELLGSKVFEEFIIEAKQSYDYILIDSPPLGQVIDAAVISSVCDASVIVVSCGKSSAKDVINVKNQLLKSGSQILGVVLNDIEAKQTSYYKKKYKKYKFE